MSLPATGAGPVADGERSEHAVRSKVLGRVIAGAVHDIRTPLNTMALRLPFIAEALLDGSAAAEAVAAHVRSVQEQFERIKDLVTRLAEATEPAAPLGWLDVASHLAQVVGVLGYEAKLRHVELVLDGPRAGVRTSADPAHGGRLVLCLVGRTLAGTTDGGRLLARAATRSGSAVVEIEWTPGDPDGDLGYDMEVLGAGVGVLGGRLDRAAGDRGLERLTLTMPGNERT
jgi:hypothetical protein